MEKVEVIAIIHLSAIIIAFAFVIYSVIDIDIERFIKSWVAFFALLTLIPFTTKLKD